MTTLLIQKIVGDIDATIKKDIATHMQCLQSRISNNEYAFFDTLYSYDFLLEALDKIAANLKSRYKQFIILGTGGSSLGGQTLCDLKQYPGHQSSVIFLSNADPITFDLFLKEINLQQTCFIVVSKSGSTAETLCQFLCTFNYFKKRNVEIADLSKHFLMITENKVSPLKEVALKLSIQCVDHPENIGGRFSIFSVVALLPALLANIDVKSLLKGAAEYLNKGLSNVIEGVTFNIQYLKKGYNITVMMPYLDQLKSFSAWYGQLWAESLGKNGQGSTPVAALGTVDQHSQLQLYRDGPQDKIFTLIYRSTSHTGLSVGHLTDDFPILNYLQGHTMGDLLEAELHATATSLARKGPIRLMKMDDCDAASLGALLTHFILETILMAEVMDINAFDQPGVEESKVLTREFLSKKQIFSVE